MLVGEVGVGLNVRNDGLPILELGNFNRGGELRIVKRSRSACRGLQNARQIHAFGLQRLEELKID